MDGGRGWGGWGSKERTEGRGKRNRKAERTAMATEEPLPVRLLPHHRRAIATALLFLKAAGISPLLPSRWLPFHPFVPLLFLLVFIVTRGKTGLLPPLLPGHCFFLLCFFVLSLLSEFSSTLSLACLRCWKNGASCARANVWLTECPRVFGLFSPRGRTTPGGF